MRVDAAVRETGWGRSSLSLTKVMGNRWPALQFMSLAFYSAWILLVMASDEAVSLFGVESTGMLLEQLYLSSGIALTVCLFLAGMFSKRVQPFIEHGPLVPLAGGIASMCTLVVAGGAGAGLNPVLFCACGAGTGIGTAAVCLRVGYVTSQFSGTDAAMKVGAAALTANLIFFTCQALPPIVSLWAISALPIAAVASSFCAPSDAGDGPDPNDLIDTKSLPRGYFPRLMCTVFTFAVAAGLVKAITALTQDDVVILGASQATWEVLVSFVAVAAFLLLGNIVLVFRNFDVSKLYIPVGFAAAVGMLLCPLFGRFLPAQGLIINVLYNVFVLVVWCLFIELAGRTTLGSTRVFGYGRGASALATTLGWAVAAFVERSHVDSASFYVTFFLIAAFILLVAVMLVLNERTVSEALGKTMDIDGLPDLQDPVPEGAAEDPLDNPWAVACADIAKEFKLTARETEVFALLSRGRSIGFIADELVIAPNTVKGYVKNVYAKAGIHSRQELIDMTESRISAVRG